MQPIRPMASAVVKMGFLNPLLSVMAPHAGPMIATITVTMAVTYAKLAVAWSYTSAPPSLARSLNQIGISEHAIIVNAEFPTSYRTHDLSRRSSLSVFFAKI